MLIFVTFLRCSEILVKNCAFVLSQSVLNNGLLDKSSILQLVDCQLADWTSRGVVSSRTRQVTDATGNFACLIFICLWPFIDVFLHVFLNMILR